ncbi:hypothetical protein ACH4PU_32775 [Streptomyces sp. NPDC021100]|uniref:hypothetical protein n=1 Tax=Streptomyces sp. NPDC021100 TaxID=3365114 RepID=UPI0037952D42
MPRQSFTISARFDEHRHPDGEGDGWTEHMRLIGDRLYYFEYGYTAQGYQTFRAYVRTARSDIPVEPGPVVSWRLVHELHTD